MARWPIPAPDGSRAAASIQSRRLAWVHANAGSGLDTCSGATGCALAAAIRTRRRYCACPLPRQRQRNMSLAHLLDSVQVDPPRRCSLLAELRAFGCASMRSRCRAATVCACRRKTPGGLKIQTIHAFCERILHLFRSKRMCGEFRGGERRAAGFVMEQARQGHVCDCCGATEFETWRGGHLRCQRDNHVQLQSVLREALGKRSDIVKASRYWVTDSNAGLYLFALG